MLVCMYATMYGCVFLFVYLTEPSVYVCACVCLCVCMSALFLVLNISMLFEVSVNVYLLTIITCCKR